MNLHVPQSYESRVELMKLSHVKNHIMSSQASQSNIKIVQDALAGSYLMTKEYKKIPKDIFFQICSPWTPEYILHKLKRIKKIRKEKGINSYPYDGHGLFSLLFPNDFNYEKKNEANKLQPIVKIYKGVLYEGAIDKKILGSSSDGIISILHKEYGPDITANVIDNIQFIANAWILYYGFSVGIEDCIATKKDAIDDQLTRCLIKGQGIKETTQLSGIRETRINMALNEARDIGMKIAKESLNEDNNFVKSITSGSKGDWFNITQITGLLGQQNVSGGRIEETLNYGTRTLLHYPFQINNFRDECESKGFISNSFIHGLNPREFYFHAMTGREGVSDTAMKTANSGYSQRRMVKCLEDLQVNYDGTVRNSIGNIVQFAYAENNLDGSKVVLNKGHVGICNISRLADKLNVQYEDRIEK